MTLCGAGRAAVTFLWHKVMPGTPRKRGFPRVLVGFGHGHGYGHGYGYGHGRDPKLLRPHALPRPSIMGGPKQIGRAHV